MRGSTDGGRTAPAGGTTSGGPTASAARSRDEHGRPRRASTTPPATTGGRRDRAATPPLGAARRRTDRRGDRRRGEPEPTPRASHEDVMRRARELRERQRDTTSRRGARVVDRLRLLWNRPLRDGDRPRLFAIAVALIAAAAAVADPARAARAPRRDRSRRHADPRRRAAAAAPAATPAVRAPAAPSEEGTRTAGRSASRADVAASKRAARRFLAGYLPYTYGRARAARIRAATDELRRRLAAQRPRVPPRERRRRPRLVLLQSDSVGHRHAELVALVDDGARRYTVALELERTAAGWHVTGVGS